MVCPTSGQCCDRGIINTTLLDSFDFLLYASWKCNVYYTTVATVKRIMLLPAVDDHVALSICAKDFVRPRPITVISTSKCYIFSIQ